MQLLVIQFKFKMFHIGFEISIQWRSLIIMENNVINRLLLSKSVVPKHST